MTAPAPLYSRSPMHAIFILENHEIVRTVLAEIIGETAGLAVGGVPDSGEAALERLPGTETDLLRPRLASR